MIIWQQHVTAADQETATTHILLLKGQICLTFGHYCNLHRTHFMSWSEGRRSWWWQWRVLFHCTTSMVYHFHLCRQQMFQVPVRKRSSRRQTSPRPQRTSCSHRKSRTKSLSVCLQFHQGIWFGTGWRVSAVCNSEMGWCAISGGVKINSKSDMVLRKIAMPSSICRRKLVWTYLWYRFL